MTEDQRERNGVKRSESGVQSPSKYFFVHINSHFKGLLQIAKVNKTLNSISIYRLIHFRKL